MTKTHSSSATGMKSGRSRNYGYAICVECKHRTRVTEWAFARRSPLRCSACGGTMDMSVNMHDEQIAVHDALRSGVAKKGRIV